MQIFYRGLLYSAIAEKIGLPPSKSEIINATAESIVNAKRNENCPVNSTIKTLPVIGALITAAKYAAIPKIVNKIISSAEKNPNSTPIDAKIFPPNAPSVKTGKNTPPGAFVPKHISVNKNFPTNKIISVARKNFSRKSSSTKTLPQPKICGKFIPIGIISKSGIKNLFAPKIFSLS